jgi:hypothetical protein
MGTGRWCKRRPARWYGMGESPGGLLNEPFVKAMREFASKRRFTYENIELFQKNGVKK